MLLVIGAYACSVIICVASASVGHAIWTLCGRTDWTWTSPAVGFALLLSVVDVTIRLPSGGWGALGAATALVLFSITRVKRINVRQVVAVAAPTVLVVGALSSGGFLVNGNFGIPGVSIENDFAGHLPWAEALRTHDAPFSLIIPGYPLGPFALAATLGELPGCSVLTGFQGIIIATPVLIGLTTLALFEHLSWVWRTLTATVVALAYLVMAAVAEGAFKEPVEALFSIAVALSLSELSKQADPPLTAAVPIGVLTAGSVANYSYPGLVWPALIVGLWLILGAVAHRGHITVRQLSRTAGAAAVAIAVLIVLALPEIVRFSAFQKSQVSTINAQTGNFSAPLPLREVLGVWFSPDFRLTPSQSGATQNLISVVAFALLLFGVVRAVLRRHTFLLALLGATLAVALYSEDHANAYNAAKSFMVLSCAAVLVTAAGLMPETGDRRLNLHGPASPRFGLAVIAAVFFAGCLWSSGLEVRGARVGPTAHLAELQRLRAMLVRHKVLFLAQDDFSGWELRGTHLAYLAVYDIPSLPIGFRSSKPFRFGEPSDFDSITSWSLDGFDYVLAPRTAFASIPPPNWREVAATKSYEVWKRFGPTPDHEILAETGGPGAILRCNTLGGLALSHRRGSALVRTPPVVLEASGWRSRDGAHAPGFTAVPDGGTATQFLTLPPGKWQVSLQYSSADPLIVKAPGLVGTLPASLEHLGPYWAGGELTSSGHALPLTVSVHPAPALATTRDEALGNVAFVRVDTHTETVPLRAACGRYVDWYTVT